MLVTVLALTLCLTTVALFPVDIFLVSRMMDPTTGLRYEWATDEAIAQVQLSVKVIYTGKCRLVLSLLSGGQSPLPPRIFLACLHVEVPFVPFLTLLQTRWA